MHGVGDRAFDMARHDDSGCVYAARERVIDLWGNPDGDLPDKQGEDNCVPRDVGVRDHTCGGRALDFTSAGDDHHGGAFDHRNFNPDPWGTQCDTGRRPSEGWV